MSTLMAVGQPDVDQELARRVAASAPVDEPLPEIPPPSIRARPVTADELASCSSARLAHKAAIEHRWDAQVMFSQGPLIGSAGTVLTTEARSLVLTCRKPDRLVRAMWLNRGQKWEMACAFELLPAPLRRMTGSELRPRLSE